MTCCASAVAAGAELAHAPSRDELKLASRALGGGLHQTDLSVPGIHCAQCIGAIEGAFKRMPGVVGARVNLSSRRVAVKWRGDDPPPIVETLHDLGYDAHLFSDDERSDPELTRLIRAMAVAGFSAMNIMLLSVSIWSGAEAETRQAFHWISAGLALPALLYSGRIFFASAWAALRRWRTNMDVPVSIGVLLAFGISLYDTITHGRHAYFDAATSLLFFLLIGRTLDHVMREKARSAVRGLMRMTPRGATVIGADGGRDYLPANAIETGMLLQVSPGERLLVDGVIESGVSDVDCSLATGESAPLAVKAGGVLRSGTLNLTGLLTLRARSTAATSFLAEMTALMEAAEAGRGRYRRIADRAASLYSPVVHATALLTLIGWLALTGDPYRAVTIAISVLIITCPCALGLAVPIVQTVAARRLFESGIMVKDGAALERLAEADMVAFDKTGTLTLGRPRLVNGREIEPAHLALAAALATGSSHPVCRALAGYGDGKSIRAEITEIPGSGIEAKIEGHLYRLGRSDWAGGHDAGRTVLTKDGRQLASFAFTDSLRAGAKAAAVELRRRDLPLLILSGDAPQAVAKVAAELGIAEAKAALLPQEKTAHIASLAEAGGKVLMVGDGLNDAPALAAAHVSMAPASASDIGRNAADFVFLHGDLSAVPLAMRVAKDAKRLIGQNFALAVLYNAIALPAAIAGQVTPLIAALAMSFSSIIVVANALRLRGEASRKAATEKAMPAAIPHSAVTAS
ncbi:heavy metal translocating P-type ATPase [Taklimakanibacter deserti]|uniref:heavy metal translocating P-type ATPase n=1 Tax=Taklimakanibacter deserti TaxID=2267839 RepID=UPI000E655E44